MSDINKWCVLSVGEPVNSYQIHRSKVYNRVNEDYSTVQFVGLVQLITMTNEHIFDDISLALLYISKMESKSPLLDEDLIEALKPIYEIERLKKENHRLRTDLNKLTVVEDKFYDGPAGFIGLPPAGFEDINETFEEII